MKKIRVGGVTIKPRLLIGEDVKTGCYAIAATGENQTADFTVLFATFAERNNKTYEEMAQALVKAAIRMDNDFPPGKNLVLHD